MEVYAKRSVSGLIQLWATVVLPPVLIVIYLIYINFDVSEILTTYWVIGGVLLLASVLYLILFGRTMFIPDIVIEGNSEELHIHTSPRHQTVVKLHDIVDIMAIKNGRMSLLRLNTVNRSYGKLIIKTMNGKYELYPLAKVDEVKKALDKLYQSKANQF